MDPEQAKKGKTRATGNGLSQVASLPLGQRALRGSRACGQARVVLVVGVAEHGVTPIRSYTEDEAIASGSSYRRRKLRSYAPDRASRSDASARRPCAG